MKEQMTYHASVQRANRIEHIVNEIGIGQVVKEKYQAGKYIYVTDTGITIVKDENKLKIITMYVTTQRELVAVFGGTKRIPNFLRKKVDHNQSKFVKGGKTIWK